MRLFVDSELNVQEYFIGLYAVSSIGAHTITNVIKDTLLRMRLQLSKCRGQCYDGASNIWQLGVGSLQTSSQKNQWPFIHTAIGHALNLAVGDTIRGRKVSLDSNLSYNGISDRRDTKLFNVHVLNCYVIHGKLNNRTQNIKT